MLLTAARGREQPCGNRPACPRGTNSGPHFKRRNGDETTKTVAVWRHERLVLPPVRWLLAIPLYCLTAVRVAVYAVYGFLWVYLLYAVFPYAYSQLIEVYRLMWTMGH